MKILFLTLVFALHLTALSAQVFQRTAWMPAISNSRMVYKVSDESWTGDRKVYTDPAPGLAFIYSFSSYSSGCDMGVTNYIGFIQKAARHTDSRLGNGIERRSYLTYSPQMEFKLPDVKLYPFIVGGPRVDLLLQKRADSDRRWMFGANAGGGVGWSISNKYSLEAMSYYQFDLRAAAKGLLPVTDDAGNVTGSIEGKMNYRNWLAGLRLTRNF